MCMLTFDYPQTYAVTGSAEEQLAQLRSYIWQLVDVLNQAGDGNEAGIGTADTAALRTELEKLRKALRDLEAKSGHGLPSGGTAGQTLTKLSDNDYDTGWRTPAGGGSGGTIAGNVIVEGTVEAEGSITIREAGSLAHIGLMPSGDNAASIVSTSSTGKSGNARLVVGTPTGDNDATTKAYVDSKIAAGGVTVDDSVSDTSTNPVQNKAIKAELDKKLDKSGGTVSGNLTVTGNVTSSGTVDGQMISGQIVTAYSSDQKKQIALECTGQNAGRFSGEVSGGVLYYARMAVATPTDDNDATTKAYVDGKVAGLQTADQVQTAINSAISGVYTPKGSIAFKSLPTAAAGNKGWVYNVTDAFTTTAAFVEGAGHAYGAGTNVVCVDVGSGSYKWDVLAGTIDLTELTADEVQTLWDSI